MIRDKGFMGKTQEYFLWETPWGHRFLVPHHVTYDEANEIIKRNIDNTRPTLN